MIGYTEIDMEDRYFCKEWRDYEKKPIEMRNILPEYGAGTQGRLEMWVELLEKKIAKNTPKEKICPPPKFEFELRAIVHDTKDCEFKDEVDFFLIFNFIFKTKYFFFYG